jgi:hypothetical protein
MFTEDWIPEEIDLYASILGVSRENVIDRPVPNQKERTEYFSQVESDAFVDPDTGLRILHERPAKGRREQRPEWSDYLFYPELRSLLPDGSDRLVVVYDQSVGRGSEREHVEVKLLALKPFLSVAYAAQAGMFVVGRESSKSRLSELHKHMMERADVQQKRLMSNF